MRLALVAAALAFAACEKAPATAEPPAAPPASAAVETPAPQTLESKGWETAAESNALLGARLPAFTAKPDNGPGISDETLRGRWTIIGFQSPGDGSTEARYVGALSSAVDQDPDLDFLSVYRVEKGILLEIPPSWPAIRDDEWKIAKVLGIDTTPAYLLIGPDLTVHAYRGAFSADPDGIKPVMRGVAEIRKKVASPR